MNYLILTYLLLFSIYSVAQTAAVKSDDLSRKTITTEDNDENKSNPDNDIDNDIINEKPASCRN